MGQPISSAPPPRPPAWEERWAGRLFRLLSPRLPRQPQPDPPPGLAPWQSLRVPRLAHPAGGSTLSATWYEAPAPARGAVLLLHPWVKWGKAYFQRGGRIEALRAAGYHAMTLDLGGFGGSAPSAGFYDRDVAAGLASLRQRAGDLPVHIWGLCSGGYWAHQALSGGALSGGALTGGAASGGVAAAGVAAAGAASGGAAVAGALFEDAALHLFEWSWRMAPRWAPGYLFFRHAFPRSFRFLDLRRHAAALGLGAVAYVSGAQNRSVLPEETRELARRAGGPCLIVPGAGHLGSFAQARDEVLALALDTFQRAESVGDPSALRRREAVDLGELGRAQLPG
jgi:pimeloyl-ACP methyl ester carboxylesterase